MLFRSKTSPKTWDGWIYWEDGTYYLYYLISKKFVCDGFGIATSTDGVSWHDHGWALRHSEKMVRYMGFGSLWRNLLGEGYPKYICNYSEWQIESGINVQTIYFAASDDLMNWHMLGNEHAFRIDERFYERVKLGASGPWEDPRWDGMCAVPRPEGGYYGYWTATPKDFLGFGFGASADGIHWEALRPPEIEWGRMPRMYFIEVGSVHEIAGKYYAMLADYASIHCGMFSFEADQPGGPFHPSSKNFCLMGNQNKMHAYFARFVDSPDGLLVNHHTLAEGQFSDERYIVYYAPLKRARLVDGALYLAWWEGNERLKGRERVIELFVETINFDTQDGIVLEGILMLPGRLLVHASGGDGTGIFVDQQGITEIGPVKADWTDFQCEERVDREVDFRNSARFRLLLHQTMLEFYLDDLFIQCYTMEQVSNGTVSVQNVCDLKLWQWEKL
jgi:hypothetical protein